MLFQAGPPPLSGAQCQACRLAALHCQSCHVTFSDQSAISAHNDTAHPHSHIRVSRPPRKEHPDARHACDVCGKKFTTRGNMLTHVSSVHSADGRRHECTVCGKAFTQTSSLNLHLRNVHGVGDVKTFLCEICSKVFRLKAKLKIHMMSVHGVGDVETFQCDICLCTLKGKLKQHMSTVHGDVKTFPCRLCSLVCSRRNLTRHMSAAHGVGDVKTFLCDVCSSL